MDDFRDELYEHRMFLAVFSLIYAICGLVGAIEGKVGVVIFVLIMWTLCVGLYFFGKRKEENEH